MDFVDNMDFVDGVDDMDWMVLWLADTLNPEP